MTRFLIIFLFIIFGKTCKSLSQTPAPSSAMLVDNLSSSSTSSSNNLALKNQIASNNNNNHPHHALSSLKPSFLPSISTSSNIQNPYPFRTMIGNLMFRLRQHRTQMLVVPSLLRIIYQYRQPIVQGLSNAYQTLITNSNPGRQSALTSGGARISNANQDADQDPLIGSSSEQQSYNYSPMFNVIATYPFNANAHFLSQSTGHQIFYPGYHVTFV